MSARTDASTARPYHHGDLRSALMEEALAMTRAGGPLPVSLREVARGVGVTPSAVYRHFRDRTELMAAVALEIQTRMAAQMRERMREMPEVDAAQQALQRVRAVGLGYIGFAVEEPGWFETAFFGGARGAESPGAATAGPADGANAGEGIRPADGGSADASTAPGAPEQAASPPPFVLLSATLDECVDAGALTVQRRRGAEYVCWAAVHGCAELVLHGPLRAAPRELVQETAERVVDDIITGIR